jgi:hypothetical protein
MVPVQAHQTNLVDWMLFCFFIHKSRSNVDLQPVGWSWSLQRLIWNYWAYLVCREYGTTKPASCSIGTLPQLLWSCIPRSMFYMYTCPTQSVWVGGGWKVLVSCQGTKYHCDWGMQWPFISRRLVPRIPHCKGTGIFFIKLATWLVLLIRIIMLISKIDVAGFKNYVKGCNFLFKIWRHKPTWIWVDLLYICSKKVDKFVLNTTFSLQHSHI